MAGGRIGRCTKHRISDDGKKQVNMNIETVQAEYTELVDGKRLVKAMLVQGESTDDPPYTLLLEYDAPCKIRPGDYAYTDKGITLVTSSNCADINNKKRRRVLGDTNRGNFKIEILHSLGIEPYDIVYVECSTERYPGMEAINPFTERRDKIRAIMKDEDMVWFEHSQTPYSIKSVELTEYRLKMDPYFTIYRLGDLERKYTAQEVGNFIREFNKSHALTIQSSYVDAWVGQHVK
jgi:hypothetical protein